MLSHSGDIPRSHSVCASWVLQNRQVGADMAERYQAAPAPARSTRRLQRHDSAARRLAGGNRGGVSWEREVHRAALARVFLLELERRTDERGFFARSFCV